MHNLNLKKFFLYLLIASVSISAVLGIGVIVLGNFGETEGKIIGTTFVITCTSILGLACGVNLEAKRGKILPSIGIFFSIISAFIWSLMLWEVFRLEELYLRLSSSTTLLAVAFSHLSLITLAKLDQRFRWANILAYLSVGALTIILLLVIWSEGSGSEFVVRTIGVLSVGVASLTVMIPIFHKLSDKLDSITAINIEIEKLQSRIDDLEQRREGISKSI